jgi:hypothetical protein
LDISNNDDIDDIFMLHSVEILDITNCPLIINLTGLTALKELSMSGVEWIESGYEVFEQLTQLTIGEVIHAIQALEKAFLSSLRLYESNLPFVSFTQLQYLTVSNNTTVTEFPATFLHLKSLRLQNCGNLVMFPALDSPHQQIE